ncbi:DNA binding protein [Natronococcus amylolyticus DSM 10524]|uniref:DNA binding protein n=1 Tax=Natronococcus amylolyticus DSM 10524 TaxID=1227497 RepID=L9XHF4_9EURY|nr:helix-turn-helix domain-containing protein [Natronococcus amylolyticus]ELY60098.1 DNA binding protein [Natronococcus amylolyticus DSM 10524]
MAIIAEFIIPVESFPLGRVFDDLPTATVEIERVIPTDQGQLPYFWIADAPDDTIQDVLTTEAAFESVTRIDYYENQGLYRAQWNPEVKGVLTAILDKDLTLLSAIGTNKQWTFEFRAEDSDQISAFQQYCADHEINTQLTRLQSLAELQAGDEYGLTANQHEALLLAFNEGYYNQPRETDLQTLADQLGISRPSFADRLHRGYHNLLRSTIAHRDTTANDSDD